MSCNNGTRRNSDDRFLAHQEHRQINRLWKKAIEKQSSSRVDLEKEFENTETASAGKRPLYQNGAQTECKSTCSPEEKQKFPSEFIQKKLVKGKSTPKIKSPLQKFDEIVSRELYSRRALEEGGGLTFFEGSKQWSGLQFTSISDFGRNKVTPDNKVSRGVLHGMEKEVTDKHLSDAQNAALMEAIEKLAQAQALCRFDAAVKAAEAATASVPPEMAEEVAVACAKDYQSEIVDVINEKMSVSEERRPIEVIGYIGVTKLKDNI